MNDNERYPNACRIGTGVSASEWGRSAEGDGPTSDELRHALITAAAEVFAEEGYSGARVAQIAERAGLTTGAMYNRFSGKSELLLEALDHYTTALLTQLADANLGATDILETVGVALLDDESPASALLLESFMAARREEDVADRLRPRLADERARLAKLVDAEKADGLVDPTLDTTAIVTFCQSVGLGMRMLSVINADMPDPHAWQQLIVRLLGSVRPDAASVADGSRAGITEIETTEEQH